MSNLDPVKNFALVEVSTTYDDTDTSIVLSTGGAAKLPNPAIVGAFNLTWWNSTDYSDPSEDPNREIVRVTAITSETLTITRGQEGITATTKNTASKTYKMTLSITKKMIDDIDLFMSNVGFANFDTDVSDTMLFTGGAYLDQPSVTVTSNGTVVTLSIEQDGGGDLRVMFLTGVYLWDTTPAATLSLTAGTDTTPQMNYVYIDEATKTLQTSTTGFPVADITRVATVLVQSAASLQTDGAYKIHAWTDHLSSSTCGHLSHMNAWIRSQHATWEDGISLTPTITTNGGAEDNVDIATGSGNVLQLHSHSYPAFDTSVSSELYIVNKSGANYAKITDLNAADEDSSGNAIANNEHINLVIWGSVNEADSKMFVNLPSDIHGNNTTQATSDAEKFSNYNIPDDYKGTGFLIARLTFKYTTAGGGTWALVENLDLRGTFPTTFAGGSVAATTVFVDSVFKILDNLDESKMIAFQASSLTTGNTRTITMPDVDVTLATPTQLTKLDNLAEILQCVIQEYNPTANQSLTQTHADIDGSDYSFTPKSATSDILYEFSFLLATETGGETVRAHLKLLNNGTLETESETTITPSGTSSNNGEIFITYSYIIQSWGTSAQTIKMQGRKFSGSYDTKLHETFSWDGTGSTSKLRRAVLKITEIE